MPAFPSGQHIAVDTAPLDTLIDQADAPSSAQLLAAIQHVDDLFGWLELITLVPAEGATAEQRANAKTVDGAPKDLVALPTGVRVSDWPAFAAARGWSDADYLAMVKFVNERVRPWLADDFEFLRKRQQTAVT